MKKTNFIVSCVLNGLLILSEIFALSICFFAWFPGYQAPTEGALDNFRFFTNDSNIFMLLASIVFLVVSIISFKKKKEIPLWATILKFTATISVLTTFLVVMTLLLPKDANMIGWPVFLFLHVVDPILAFVSLAFFEAKPILRKRDSFFSLLPLVIYTAIIAPLSSLHKINDPYEMIHLMDVTADTPGNIALKWLGIFFGTLLVGFLVILLQRWMGRLQNKPVHEQPQSKETAEPLNKDNSSGIPAPSEVAQDDVVVIQDEEGTENSEEEEEIKEEEEAKKTNPTGYMNRPRVYHVAKQLETGKWQVRLATGQKAIKLFDTQELAINYAKSLVKTQGGSIRVHSLKGKMRKE
jgi:hypothetical protein